MAGIMKFFKPTEGGAGSVKKAEQPAVGSTAREVFSLVGNTKVVHRAAVKLALEADSDVELVGEEATAGLKRKRKDTGQAASGLRSTTGVEPGVASCAQEAPQQRSFSSNKDGPLDANPGEAVTADVEMSPNAGANLASGASSPGAGPSALPEADGAVMTVPDQVLSPDVAALQPTAKRQRVPEEVTEPALPSSGQPNEHNGEMENEEAVSNPQQHQAVVGAVVTPQPVTTAGTPEVQQLPPPDPHQPMELQPPPSQSIDASRHPQDRQPAASQQQQSDGGADTADAGGGVAAATTDGDIAVAAPAICGAVGGAGGAATGGAGAKSGATGPATLPPDMDLGTSLETLRREQADLEGALEAELLLPETESSLSTVAAASEGGRLLAMPTPAQLCSWLEGRTGSLTQLVGRLVPLLPPGADPTALRTSLVDLAQRRCYSAKEAPLEGAAASDDATPGRLWVWEVREPRKHLQGETAKDTAARKLAEAMRKRRKELRERLVAVGSAVEALSHHQALLHPSSAAAGSAAKGPSAAARRASESRAAKAWNRLGRLAELEAVEAAYRVVAEGLSAGAGAAAASARRERVRKQQLDKEKERLEKEKEREEKERRREEERQEKEREKEEKARQREEEARAKEAKRTLEDEAKRRARETAAANKKGYHSKEELQKSRSIMQSFVKRTAQPKGVAGAAAGHSGGAAIGADGPAGGTSSAADGGGATASGPGAMTSQPQLQPPRDPTHGTSAGGAAAPSGGRGCSQPAGATPSRERAAPTTMFDFSKLACRLPDKALVEALDASASQLPLPAEELAAELRANGSRWRQQRAARRRMIGVPPTWARRPSAPTDLRTLAAQYYGDVAALGLAPEGLRTWRRKLLAFPRKETARPPYYGSFSRTSTSVTGRRPFGRDTSLDYEVASDEEWEEEPEGESLSDSGDEADSQAGGGPGEGGEDEDDGFIVGDDHLSDDEGAQLSGDPDEPMFLDGVLAKGAARAGPASGPVANRFVDPRLQQLEAAIERVRTNNRPILLVRPTPLTAVPAATPPTTSSEVGVAAAPSAGAEGVEMEPAVVGAATAVGLCCRLRAEARPGLNTGLDPGLLGALRPVVHFRCGEPGVPVAALASPLELDIYSAYAAAGTGGGGVLVSSGGAEEAMLAAGGTPGGGEALAAAVAAGAGAPGGALLAGGGSAFAAGAPGSARRAPGSGTRGRPPQPGLNDVILTALAELMLRCGDQKMEKIVEGFLASLPPDTKTPAKIKLREAIKRLGAWSASAKRWHLHGGSVAAAVQHALAAAATAAATAAGGGGGAQGGTPLTAAALVAAAGVRGLVVAGGGTSTPTPGPLLPPGLPAPTPAPHLGPLPSPRPTPSTALDGRPLLPAPASTPLNGALAAPGPAAHRPTGTMVLPEHLMQALARLVPEAPSAATPMPLGAPGLVDTTVTAVQQAAPAGTPIPPPQQQQRTNGYEGGRAETAAAADGADREAMDCDEPPAAERQPLADSCEAAAHSSDGQEAAGAGGVAAAARPGLPLAATRREDEESGGRGEICVAAQDGGGGGEIAAAAMEAMGEGSEAVEAAHAVTTLPRPMPPAPPPLSELALLGSGHPFWGGLASWVMGGGGAAARSRRHGPSRADVSAALTVFGEPEELEPRLGWVPLDLVRVLVAVCQHRSASHLRSGAFKALANLTVALVRQRTGTCRGGNGLEAAAPTAHGSGGCAFTAPAGLRPTGQPSRCSPQPVTLPSLCALPGLMDALRRGCCEAYPDSETDKAARSAARVLAALAGVGISSPQLTAGRRTAAIQAEPQGQQHQRQQQCDAEGAAAAAAAEEEQAGGAARQQLPLAPEVTAAATAFRLRVVTNPHLHTALRDAAAHGPGPGSSAARHVFHAHMLLALQRLLRDPAVATRLLRPKTRLARKATAAAEGRPPPPPASPELESKWAARLLGSLVAGGRDMTHTGCRKGMVQAAAALLDLPALAGVMAPREDEVRGQTEREAPQPEAAGVARDGAGGGGWSSLLSGNDPRAQLPAVVLTLLISELRHVAAADVAVSGCAGGEEEGEQPSAARGARRQSRRQAAADDDRGGDEAGDRAPSPLSPAPPAPLDKCARGRVVLVLQLAERALRHLARPSARLQLRQADTRAAVAELQGALADAGEVLAASYDSQLQSLYTAVGSLSEALV